jgi:hypothetical protein
MNYWWEDNDEHDGRGCAIALLMLAGFWIGVAALTFSWWLLK